MQHGPDTDNTTNVRSLTSSPTVGSLSRPRFCRREDGCARRARDWKRRWRTPLSLIGQAGGGNVRVFGSVATGAERAGSDIDLLSDMGVPMGLTSIEAELADAS